MVANMVYNFGAAILRAGGDTKRPLYYLMFSGVVNVVLNIICINRYGYMAAAYTTLVTYVLYFVFHYVIAWRIHKGCLYDTGRLSWYAVLSLMAGAISLVFIGQWILRWGLLVILGILFVVWGEREFGIIGKIKAKFARK